MKENKDAKQTSYFELEGGYLFFSAIVGVLITFGSFMFFVNKTSKIEFSKDLKIDPEIKSTCEKLFFQLKSVKNVIEKAKTSKNWQELKELLKFSKMFKIQAKETFQKISDFFADKQICLDYDSVLNDLFNLPNEFDLLNKDDDLSIQELFKNINLKDSPIAKGVESLVNKLESILQNQPLIGTELQKLFSDFGEV